MVGDMEPARTYPEERGGDADDNGTGEDGGKGDESKGGQKLKKDKRIWQKVNAADYYNPVPYTAQKGVSGKGKGKGKGDRDERDGAYKGKGKGDRHDRSSGDRGSTERGSEAVEPAQRRTEEEAEVPMAAVQSSVESGPGSPPAPIIVAADAAAEIQAGEAAAATVPANAGFRGNAAQTGFKNKKPAGKGVREQGSKGGLEAEVWKTDDRGTGRGARGFNGFGGKGPGGKGGVGGGGGAGPAGGGSVGCGGGERGAGGGGFGGCGGGGGCGGCGGGGMGGGFRGGGGGGGKGGHKGVGSGMGAPNPGYRGGGGSSGGGGAAASSAAPAPGEQLDARQNQALQGKDSLEGMRPPLMPPGGVSQFSPARGAVAMPGGGLQAMQLPMAYGGMQGAFRGMPAYSMGGMPFSPYDGMPTYPMGYPYAQMPAFFVQLPQGGMPPGVAPFLGGPALHQHIPLSPADRQLLRSQVQTQIAYYFGHENLIKDIHLRTNCMNQEGWVSILALANFRRIQNMTMDITIINEAIAGIPTIEVDPSGLNLRLKEGWKLWVLGSPEAGES